ncbi:hypothetical protein [Bosea sp. FBZP-16]|uniref:hypothetical protein n=1 Tax=Bosea sp. FBZP-16 TaxID=2065382 RepID=UPI000C310F18|nr:hypothetical protein [Bosea sp. FBZP-16]
MLTLTVAATLAVLAPLAWLLVETSRRRWLAFAIPALVALPLAFYAYGSSLLGYAVATAPKGEFDVVHASVDEARGMVLLLIATPDGARLHTIPATEQARKQAGSAQAALEKGLPVRGRAGTGADQNEGDLVFYVLPPMAQPKG